MSLRVIPLDLKEANACVTKWHRHHKPVVGHRFSVGCVDDNGELHGVAIASRPIARCSDQRFELEVTRVATNGTHNACSILLGAVAKAAKSLGYVAVKTTTLEHESGSSLKAVGWKPFILDKDGLGWDSRDNRNVDCKHDRKVRWVKELNHHPKLQELPMTQKDNTGNLFQ